MITLKQKAKLQIVLNSAHEDFEKELRARAYFKLNDRTLSEDLVQDTFIKTWSYLVRVGKVDMMRAFLYHILSDLIIDEYRKRKLVSLDQLMENGFDPSSNSLDTNNNIFDGTIATHMIGDLPKKYQVVMRMKYVKELTLKEMSLLTGQSKNTIAVQLHRGLEMLKSLYAHKR